MYRLAKKSDMPGIVALWGEAFGDNQQAVEEFFTAFPACISCVAEERGEILAMAHAIPQSLSPDTKAVYVYAVATAKAHRGKGLCRNLMAFLEQDLKARGVEACVLTPANAGLFQFYKNLGYDVGFFRQHTPFSGGRPIPLSEYVRRRKTLLSVPHMVCDENFLSYAQKLYGLTFYETATGLAAHGEGFTAEVLPEDLGGEPFAMVKWLDGRRKELAGFLGLSLQ